MSYFFCTDRIFFFSPFLDDAPVGVFDCEDTGLLVEEPGEGDAMEAGEGNARLGAGVSLEPPELGVAPVLPLVLLVLPLGEGGGELGTGGVGEDIVASVY